MASDNEVRMMMSVYPGAMTGFAALNSGLVSINNVFMSMTRSMDAQFGLINTAIMTTGVVVAQLGMDAMNAFGEFEQGMKIVQMVSGQTTQEINTLKQAANDFSVSYRMDIDQITEGLQTLGRAGLNNASEQAEVLKNGLNTAKLEGRDLNGVLQELIQNTALLGGDLKSSEFGEDSQYVNDLLVATSMTAPITTHDISETLKYSGGIAAAAGAHIRDEKGNIDEHGKAILEDYMGAIAAFAQKGVSGSIAGTALRAFFNKPATQDSSVKEALASIKLKPEYLWEDDEETMKPVSEQIALIKKQMDELNISTMDQLQIWSKIVGGKMGQQMMKLDSESIKDITKDIRAADDATSLAQRSMQTYQANVKELGEMGARLQRNVGGNLVQIANPILDIIVKVMEFAQNDVMSWPITAGIIAFIGLAGKKAMSVISALKAELSTLFRGMQTFYTQKQGWVGPTPPPFEREWGGKTKGSQGEKATSNAIKDVSKMTLSEYNKHISQGVKGLSIGDYKKMGVSDSNIAMMARMQSLSKDSFKIGISDKEFARIIGQTGVLTKAQQAQMDKMLAGTTGARNPFDAMFGKGKLDSGIAKQIAQNELAVKEFKKLGITLSDLGIVSEEEINIVKQQIAAANTQANSLKAQTDFEIGLAEVIDLTNTSIKKQFADEEKLRLESEAHVTSLGQETTATNSATVATDALTVALNGYVPASQRFIQSINKGAITPIMTGSPIGIDPKNGTLVLGGFGNSPVLNNDGLKSNYIANAAYRDYLLQKGLQGNYTTPTEAEIKAEKDRVQKLRESTPYYTNRKGVYNENITGFYSQKGDPQAEYWNRKGQGYIEEDRKTSAGKYSGAVLSKEEQDAVAKKLGLGSHAKDTPLETARKKAAKNLEDGTSPMSKTGGALISMKGAANRMEKEFDATTKTLEEKRSLNDRIMARQASITRGSMPRDPAGMGRFGLGRSDVLRIQEEASVSNKRRPYTSRGSLSEKSSGAIIGRSDVRRIANESRDAAANSVRKLTSDSIKNSMETNSLQKKLNNEVNKLVNSNKQLGSTYLNGIQKANQSISSAVAAHNQANFSKKFYQDLKQQTVPSGITRYYQQNGVSVIGGKYTMLDGIVGPYTPIDTYKPSSQRFGSAFYANLTDRLNRNRAGSFLSFGNKMVDGVLTSSTKGLTGFGNKLLNATDAVGGPFMVAIMAASFAIQAWQKAFQDYCDDLKEAGDKLKEAYSNLESADSALEKKFREGNPDATDDEIDQMMYDTYSEMGDKMAQAFTIGEVDWLRKMGKETKKSPEYEYDEEADDGTLKEKKEDLTAEQEYTKAIKENTGALYSAANEVSKALNNYVRVSQDSWWGIDGWTGWLTDQFGGFMDTITHFDTQGSTFSENGTEFLLTQSQADENYAGYTEMAGLMLEDFKDARGDWVSGMKTMMGEDADALYRAVGGSNSSVDKYLTDMAKFSSGQDVGGLSRTQNAKLQQSMKNDPKTWKKLSKELAKRDVNKKLGKDITKNQNRIKGLTEKIRSIVGKGFKDSQIQRAAYINQLQEMKKIADQAVVPIMQENLGIAGQTLSATGNVGENTGNTVGTTGSTNENAAIIAGLVAIIARQSAKAEHFDQIISNGPTGDNDFDNNPGTEVDRALYERATQSGMTADEFYKENAKLYNAALEDKKILDQWGVNHDAPTTKFLDSQIKNAQGGMAGYVAIAETTSKMTAYNYDKVSAAEKGRALAKEMLDKGLPLKDVFATIDKNYTLSEEFKNDIINSYLAADEDDEGTGSGSGSGDGNKDKNSGTKKERVDLVLCSKKEIPKLNVNLFKKPPTFTVLNKNFKVRDVKINTEDTPKAIMSSIKNAFIDVQKRSDPKIIQDEDAVYDPNGATDGNPLPSGSAKTKTDSS